MKRLLIIILLLTIIPDIIIWFIVFPDLSIGWKSLFSIPTLMMLSILPGFDKKRLGYILRKRIFFTIILALILPKLVFSLLAWPFGWRVALVGVVCLIAVLLYGFTRGWQRLALREETFVFDDLPETFDGYKIVQVSDLHLGSFANHPEYIEKVVCLANEQNADLLVFTGDLVNIYPEEAEPYIEILGKLKAKDGVFSILGNHDCYYIWKVKEQEKKIGWELLFNKHVFIRRNDDSIALIGVEQIGKTPFEPKGQLKKAMAGIPKNTFKILLSHDPTHWRIEVLGATDIRLTLSGHTHAAQMKLGRLSPARLFFKEWGGKYEKNGQTLFVSLGIGGNVPFRLGAWPEINIITLKKSDKL